MFGMAFHRMSRALVVGGTVLAAAAWGEWLNRRWSRTLVTNGEGTSQAIVVLGYRNPQAKANFINRWRVRTALRSRDRPSRVIFSGGSHGGGPSEARLMADYASALGFTGPMVLEEHSRTTYENVTNVIPMLEDVDRVKIVSQPAHALKARAYMRRQRPDLAMRLVNADDNRKGEWLPFKPILAAYGLWTLRGIGPDERRLPSDLINWRNRG